MAGVSVSSARNRAATIEGIPGWRIQPAGQRRPSFRHSTALWVRAAGGFLAFSRSDPGRAPVVWSVGLGDPASRASILRRGAVLVGSVSGRTRIGGASRKPAAAIGVLGVPRLTPRWSRAPRPRDGVPSLWCLRRRHGRRYRSDRLAAVEGHGRAGPWLSRPIPTRGPTQGSEGSGDSSYEPAPPSGPSAEQISAEQRAQTDRHGQVEQQARLEDERARAEAAERAAAQARRAAARDRARADAPNQVSVNAAAVGCQCGRNRRINVTCSVRSDASVPVVARVAARAESGTLGVNSRGSGSVWVGPRSSTLVSVSTRWGGLLPVANCASATNCRCSLAGADVAE